MKNLIKGTFKESHTQRARITWFDCAMEQKPTSTGEAIRTIFTDDSRSFYRASIEKIIRNK